MLSYAATQWRATGAKNQLVLGPSGRQAVLSAEGLKQMSKIKIPDPGSASTSVILADSASGTQTIRGNVNVTGTLKVNTGGGGGGGGDSGNLILDGDLVFKNSEDRAIRFDSVTTTTGKSLSILGNDGTEAGGPLVIKSGEGGTTGGDLSIDAGTGSSNNGAINVGFSVPASEINIGNDTMPGNVKIYKQVQITPTTNQLVLGGGGSTKTSTLSATAPTNTNRTYTIYDTDSDTNVLLGIRKIRTITGSDTLSYQDSGSLVLINAAGALTLKLPPVAKAGVNYKIIFNVDRSGTFTLSTDTGTELMWGGNTDNYAVSIEASQFAGVPSIAAGAGAHFGDVIDVFSTGTVWSVWALSGASTWP